MNERIRLHVDIITGVLASLSADERREVLLTAAERLGLTLDVDQMNVTLVMPPEAQPFELVITPKESAPATPLIPEAMAAAVLSFIPTRRKASFQTRLAVEVGRYRPDPRKATCIAGCGATKDELIASGHRVGCQLRDIERGLLEIAETTKPGK